MMKTMQPLLWIGIAYTIAAFDVSGQVALSAAEKTRAVEVMSLVHSVLADDRAITIESLFNQLGPIANVLYESEYDVPGIPPGMPPGTSGASVPAKVGDLALNFYAAVDSDRVRKSSLLGEGSLAFGGDGSHDNFDLGNILIDEAMDASGLVGSQMVLAWIRLGAAGLRETMHAFQSHFPNSVSSSHDCDAERDAESMVLRFLDAAVDDVESAPATAHTTIAAVEDAQLKRRMLQYGMVDADLTVFHDRLARFRSWIDQRKAVFIDNSPNPLNDWIFIYSSIVAPSGKMREIVGTNSVVVEKIDGSSLPYPVTSGHQIVNAKVFRQSISGKSILLIVSTPLVGSPSSGDLFVTIHVDDDADGFPDTTPTGATVLAGNVSGSPTRPLHSVPIYVTFGLQQTAPTATVDFVLIHDREEGTIIGQRIPSSGSIPAAAEMETSSQIRFNGSHPHFHSIRMQNFSQVRATFIEETRARSRGATLSRAYQGPLSSTLNATSGATRLAQARSPEDNPNSTRLHGGYGGPFTLEGDPNQTVVLESRGRSGIAAKANAAIGIEGRITATTISPIAANDILSIFAGPTARRFFFAPSTGIPISSARIDETADGLIDRIDLTVRPSRLHFSAATTPDVYQHSFEQALERDELGPIVAWSASDRRIGSIDDRPDLSLTPIANLPFPAYASSFADYDGNNAAHETVIIRRADAAAAFSFWSIAAADGPNPSVIQTLQLPNGFSPSQVVVGDVDFDLDLDVTLPDVTGGHATLTNDGTGVFTLSEICFNLSGVGQRGLAGQNLLNVPGALNAAGRPTGDSIDPFGPHHITVPVGSSWTMSFSGVPMQPIVLLASPHLLPGSVRLGAPVVEDQVDIADCDLADLIVIFDPYAPVIGNFFNTGPTGTSTFVLPANAPFETSLQGIIFTGGADVIAMTNAIRLEVQ